MMTDTERSETSSVGYQVAALRNIVRMLHRLRAEYAERKQRLADLEAAFQDANRTLIDEIAEWGNTVAEADRDARRLAESFFNATGDQRPVPGVEIKLYKGCEYDVELADRWAVQTGMFLVPAKCDTRALEKAAPSLGLSWITLTSTPKATLAKDLTSAVAKITAAQEDV